jgi:hypothetical protein
LNINLCVLCASALSALFPEHFWSVFGGHYESQGVGKEAVSELQGGAPQGCGAHHLLGSAPQTAPRLNS